MCCMLIIKFIENKITNDSRSLVLWSDGCDVMMVFARFAAMSLAT